MAEICSGGLWHVDGCGDCARSLPIPPNLVARIEAWADWYDELDAANDRAPNPLYWEQRDDMPVGAFNAEGRAIGHALKAALPPDWTVLVVDVDNWCRLRPDGGVLILRPSS